MEGGKIKMLSCQNLKSPHPKIQYWFWDQRLLESQAFEEQLDLLVQKSDFNTIILTERDGVNFWDKSLRPYFEKAIKLAHERNLQIILQIWPEGHFHKCSVDLKDAVALAVECEDLIENGTVTLESICTSVRNTDAAPPIGNKILKAYAFKKTGEGFYKENSLKDITHLAKICENQGHRLQVSFEIPDLEGYTIYMLTAHYYQCVDLFSPRALEDYKCLIDDYKDLGFDSFVLDEFRNLSINPPWKTDCFRDRFYGDHFSEYFFKQTERELESVLFDMRYCPAHQVNVKISAINLYFELFRHSTKRTESFVADYAKKICGKNAFIGLHNTYHNRLGGDELWMTGCNWWEVPRDYAQTDEDIGFPIRLGIACGCKESLMYDMFYNKDRKTFADKAMRDAAFGGRLHYHAMNDLHWGVNTGSSEFLDFIKPIEDKITLLNCFDPQGLPKMELLVVFGFPRLCNWYPDEVARSKFDMNRITIEKRCNDLWDKGYFNALAPSDAIDDGRITMDEGGSFDYCGHKFQKLLYLYPEYAKEQTILALEKFAKSSSFSVLGDLNFDYYGNKIDGSFLKKSQLSEDDDIVVKMNLVPNQIPNGCRLEDGSIVIADPDFSREKKRKTAELEILGHSVRASYKGVFAIKLTENGEIEKFACGDCAWLEIDGKKTIENENPSDLYLCMEKN